ncbi:MAG: sugar phosphate isomerase/epimerase family protein [Cyclobacteriaceae bacterium]
MNRRNAIIAGGLTALFPASIPAMARASSSPADLKIGIAGYSFAHYKNNLSAIISVMQQTGIKHMTLKDFQLPYESTAGEAAALISQLRKGGIEPYGLGVIYMEQDSEVDRSFSYAARAGIKIIIGSPAEKTLAAVERNVKSTGIRIAIHNHGPEDKRYPDIDTIYKLISDMDSGIGICLDIGHSFRCGHNPAEMLDRFGDRVMDMHIKDVTEPVAGGISTIPGRGQINISELINTASRIGYKGFCSLEYERPGDPAIGIAESIGYIKGLIKGLSGRG